VNVVLLYSQYIFKHYYLVQISLGIDVEDIDCTYRLIFNFQLSDVVDGQHGALIPNR